MHAQSLIALLAICSVGVSSSVILSVHSENRVSATPEHFETSKVSRSKLRKHDRLRLVEAQGQGEKELTLLIASVEGANRSVLRVVASLGGSVQYRDDDVSYLRVKVPTENVEKLGRSPDIQSLNIIINGMMDYLNSPPPEPSPGIAISNRIPPPGRNTPAENPYLPSRDIGSPQFSAQHPTFDGRGATIAIVDGSIDLLSPELQTAKTLDGRPTRKIANVLTAERDALVPDYENSRISGYVAINMGKEVMAYDGKLTHEGVTYAVPAQITFRLGFLNERMNNAKDDLNRDGNPENSSNLFAVLWHEKTNTVWVDTNQDHSFINEKRMTDYHVNNDVGIFGKDDPATAIRETVGFTVQTDATHKVVYVMPGYSSHGTGVAGVAAGKNFFGGLINGVAPEAQIISVPFGGQKVLPSEVESIILAVKHPQVDVVSVQISFVVPLNDGRSTLSIICNRLIEKYKKLIFFSSGNSSGALNFINEGATASKAIAVGSYIHRETARVNYGIATDQEHNLDAFTGHGPAKNGTFKPNILAPTVSLTTWPGFLPSQTYGGTYELPPGYGVGGGTSTSTPIAAGAAALLISAAKQNGVKYDADRLRWAIMSSARYLQNYKAHEQGAGCFQVGAAWEALKNAPDIIEIVSRAPVLAALSQYLDEPNRGVGIFEREGWSLGQSGQRSIVLTRISGESKPMTFRARWLGNDGIFSSPSALTLPLNSPVTIPIAVNAKSPGVHSAIFNLDIPGGSSAIYQIMNTIVVAHQFVARSGFIVTEKAQADWMRESSCYLNVPAGTRALKLDVKIAQGNVMPYLLRPSGAFYWPLPLKPMRPTDYQEAGTWSRIISRPDVGVWQLVVANKNLSEKARLASPTRAIVEISATILTATAIQTARPLELLSTDANYTRSVSFTNQLGSFLGGVADLPLGSAFSETRTIDANRPLQIFELSIPPGTRTLNARIDGANDTLADLDLYLFDCTKGTCKLKDFSTNDRAAEEVYVQDPAAGKWKVFVDPFSGESKIKFIYFDFFAHPAFGVLKSTGKSSYHLSGTTWTERISVTVDATPTGSRYLAGFIAVMAQPETKQDHDTTTATAQNSINLATAPLGVTKITVRKIEKAARASISSRE